MKEFTEASEGRGGVLEVSESRSTLIANRESGFVLLKFGLTQKAVAEPENTTIIRSALYNDF